MAIDYGKKRTGIAVTDPLQMIANGLTTIDTKQIITFLEDYLKTNTVDCFVMGLPKKMNNEPSESMEGVKKMVNQLQNKFPAIVLEYMDERFTSKMAMQAMIDGGVKKMDRRNKELVDTVSATIILQSYLEQKQFKSSR